MNGETLPVRLKGEQQHAHHRLTRAAQAGTPCAGDPRFIDHRPTVQAEAASACAPCRIRETCLAYGLAYPKERGVYGGLTYWQRSGVKEDAA